MGKRDAEDERRGERGTFQIKASVIVLERSFVRGG